MQELSRRKNPVPNPAVFYFLRFKLSTYYYVDKHKTAKFQLIFLFYQKKMMPKKDAGEFVYLIFLNFYGIQVGSRQRNTALFGFFVVFFLFQADYRSCIPRPPQTQIEPRIQTCTFLLPPFFSQFLLSFFFTQLLFFMKIFVPSTNSHFYHFDLELSRTLLGNFVWGYPHNFEKMGVFAVAWSAARKASVGIFSPPWMVRTGETLFLHVFRL